MPSTEFPFAASGDGVIWLSGEHDVANVAQLSRALALATAGNEADLVIDMSGVEFMGASTIGAIVHARNVLQSQSRDLVVRSPSKRAERLLHLCGLSALISVPTSPPSALATWVNVPRADRAEDSASVAKLAAAGSP